MKCRGERNRTEICRKFIVKPIARFKLADGESFKSDAGGRLIVDECVIFTCESSDGNVEIIHCGVEVAKELCTKSGTVLPKSFNIYRKVGGGGGGNNDLRNEGWNNCKKQLYNAVQIMIVYFGNIKHDSPLICIKTDIEKDIKTEPKMAQIKGVNTIIKKSGKTLEAILAILARGRDVRPFQFDLLINKLKEKNIDQYFSND